MATLICPKIEFRVKTSLKQVNLPPQSDAIHP